MSQPKEDLKDLTDEEILARLGEDAPEPVSVKTVEGASGAVFEVADDAETVWFNLNMGKYLEEYRFENVADLQDLDRLMGMELFSYRYAGWLLSGSTHDGKAFDQKSVRAFKKEVDIEIRLTKKHMGMDRKGRVESEQQSTAEYLSNLLRRAKEFGVHRDNQIAKAVDIVHDLKKLIGVHDRTDEEERRHLGVSESQIVEWIREVAIPEYDEIDDAFRVNQRLWIKTV